MCGVIGLSFRLHLAPEFIVFIQCRGTTGSDAKKYTAAATVPLSHCHAGIIILRVDWQINGNRQQLNDRGLQAVTTGSRCVRASFEIQTVDCGSGDIVYKRVFCQSLISLV